MPAPKRRFYSAKDVQEILGIEKTKANQILNMFEYRGQLFRDGKVKRVRVEIFEAWLDEMDGYNNSKKRVAAR